MSGKAILYSLYFFEGLHLSILSTLVRFQKQMTTFFWKKKFEILVLPAIRFQYRS